MKYVGKAFGSIEPSCFDGAMFNYYLVNADGSLGYYGTDYDGYDPIGIDLTWLDRWIQYRTGSPWTQTTYITNIKHKFLHNIYPDTNGQFIETGIYGTVKYIDGGNNSINIVLWPGTVDEYITNYGNHPIISPYRCNYTPLSLTIGVG